MTILQDKAWEILMTVLQHPECMLDDIGKELGDLVYNSYKVADKFLSFDIKALREMESDK